MVSSERGLQEQRMSAIAAGTALMIMIVAAAFSYGFVHSSLLVPEDGTATLRNIAARKALFQAEIFGWLIILVCDIVVAWACCVFLKPVNHHLSLLGAWLRLVYSAMLGAAIANLLFVLLLSNSADRVSGPALDNLGAQAMLHLDAFDAVWSLGLIIFGGHLLILGLLALRSDSIPGWIAILLIVASFGYMLIHAGNLFLPDSAAALKIVELVFIVPMTAGETGFGVWLLWKGGKTAAARG